MRHFKKIMFLSTFFSLLLISNYIATSSCATANYVGVCPNAQIGYNVTKSYFPGGYVDHMWTITITSIESGEDLVGNKPGMILYTQVTGENITDLYYNDHMFVYENQSELNRQSICTGEIKWVINKGLGGQNYSYSGTNLYYDENGVLANGTFVKVEGSWYATYTITRTSIDLGNCNTTPGFIMDIFILLSVVTISLIIVKSWRKKAIVTFDKYITNLQ